MMNKDSEITPSRSLSPAVLRASSTLRFAGNIGFWTQIVLGVVAAIILLFASASLFGDQKPNPGIGFGFFCAFSGVIALIISIFFFFRYRTIARMMQDPYTEQRPSKSYTLQVIKFGLIANLLGMLLSIIGAEALIGLLLGKFLNLPQGAVTSTIDPSQLLKAGEIMIILANTHTIASHFTGIVIALGLLDRLNK
jgi:hypothetical protein